MDAIGSESATLLGVPMAWVGLVLLIAYFVPWITAHLLGIWGCDPKSKQFFWWTIICTVAAVVLMLGSVGLEWQYPEDKEAYLQADKELSVYMHIVGWAFAVCILPAIILSEVYYEPWTGKAPDGTNVTLNDVGGCAYPAFGIAMLVFSGKVLFAIFRSEHPILFGCTLLLVVCAPLVSAFMSRGKNDSEPTVIDTSTK